MNGLEEMQQRLTGLESLKGGSSTTWSLFSRFWPRAFKNAKAFGNTEQQKKALKK